MKIVHYKNKEIELEGDYVSLKSLKDIFVDLDLKKMANEFYQEETKYIGDQLYFRVDYLSCYLKESLDKKHYYDIKEIYLFLRANIDEKTSRTELNNIICCINEAKKSLKEIEKSEAKYEESMAKIKLELN